MLDHAPIKDLPADHYSLRLTKELPGSGYLFILEIKQPSAHSAAFVDNFRATCFEHLGSAPMGMTKPAGVRHNNWFLQGNTPDWVMFEFWTDDHDAILEGVFRVVAALEVQGLSVAVST